MIRDIKIEDEDAGRVYELQVRFQCREEIGGAPGVACDVNGVLLENCVVWLGDYGCEVHFDDSDRRKAWAREVAIRYEDDIRAACIAVFESERHREPDEFTAPQGAAT